MLRTWLRGILEDSSQSSKFVVINKAGAIDRATWMLGKKIPA